MKRFFKVTEFQSHISQPFDIVMNNLRNNCFNVAKVSCVSTMSMKENCRRIKFCISMEHISQTLGRQYI